MYACWLQDRSNRTSIGYARVNTNTSVSSSVSPYNVEPLIYIRRHLISIGCVKIIELEWIIAVAGSIDRELPWVPHHVEGVCQYRFALLKCHCFRDCLGPPWSNLRVWTINQWPIKLDETERPLLLNCNWGPHLSDACKMQTYIQLHVTSSFINALIFTLFLACCATIDIWSMESFDIRASILLSLVTAAAHLQYVAQDSEANFIRRPFSAWMHFSVSNTSNHLVSYRFLF